MRPARVYRTSVRGARVIVLSVTNLQGSAVRLTQTLTVIIITAANRIHGNASRGVGPGGDRSSSADPGLDLLTAPPSPHTAARRASGAAWGTSQL